MKGRTNAVGILMASHIDGDLGRYDDSFVLDPDPYLGCDLSKVYLASNDGLGRRFFGDVFCGVANLDSLNVYGDINTCFFFYDINADQVNYLKKVIDLIKKHSTRKDFFGAYFGGAPEEIKGWVESQVEVNYAVEYDSQLGNYFSDCELVDDVLLLPQSHKIIGGFRPQLKLVEEASNSSTLFMIRENGFLNDDYSYDHLRNALLSMPIIYSHDPIDAGMYKQLQTIFRYEYVGLWTSNICTPYFYCKEVRQFVDCVVTDQVLDQRLKLTWLQDSRQPFCKNFKHKVTRHEKTFKKVLDNYDDNLIEIVNGKDNTTCLPDCYVSRDLCYPGETIYLHHLISHGKIDPVSVLENGIKKGWKKIIITESVECASSWKVVFNELKLAYDEEPLFLDYMMEGLNRPFARLFVVKVTQ